MTFVIKDKMDSVDDYLDPDNTFDPTIYNYLINRRNCFTSDNLVGENYEKLYFILTNMEKVDPILLEQLHYYYFKEDNSQEANGSVKY
jgi:hypothetical protein